MSDFFILIFLYKKSPQKFDKIWYLEYNWVSDFIILYDQMKQKRKVKSLLPYKIDKDGTMLTILLLILSLVLCLWSASLMTVSVWATDDTWKYSMVYPWRDDRVEVLYWLQISDKNKLWDEFVNQFFMKDKTLYLSPNQVKVKSKDSFGDNTVDTWKYINVLWWEDNNIKSDNITLIAWNWNGVEELNDSASILWWQSNKIEGMSSWAPAVIAWWDENKIINNNSNVIIWWNKNTITGAENAVILWWENNTVNGRKNIIVWWSNVEVNGVDNVFVYSNSSSKFKPESSNAFYLNLSDWVGINADAARKWLSVSGAVGFGEININTKDCNDANIWVIWSWSGCLVWCTKESGNRWELLDRWVECEKKCSFNSYCYYKPLSEEEKEDRHYTGFCTDHVSIENATRCTNGENNYYSDVVFQTVLIGASEECPVSGDNKCVYRCNPGSDLDVTSTSCHQKCKLPWDSNVEVRHGYFTGAYNTADAFCAEDDDNKSIDTCAKHRHNIVCDNGDWFLADKNWKIEPQRKLATGYVYEFCMLDGYRCKTDANNYNLTVNYIKDTLNDTSSKRVVKDRTKVNGTRWQYKICIDYNPKPEKYPKKALNWDSCDTWTVTPQPYHYKFIGCQTGNGYFPFTGNDWVVRCMKDCVLTGENGKLTSYRHNTSITGYKAKDVTCTGSCQSANIVCNDGTWKLWNANGSDATEYKYSSCTLHDKVCAWFNTGITQTIYNQYSWTSIYGLCDAYKANGNACIKQDSVFILKDCKPNNHTEPGHPSWMKWCISNTKEVNCSTWGKDPSKYDFIITWVKITWSGSWNEWHWTEPKACEWKCGEWYHLSGDYNNGGECVSNTWSAPCKTWWADGHVKYNVVNVEISWVGTWNEWHWTEPGNCALLTWECEVGRCWNDCSNTGVVRNCTERTNLRSWEVNIITSSFVACGNDPELCELKCTEGYHTGENWWCEPDWYVGTCPTPNSDRWVYDTGYQFGYYRTNWWTDLIVQIQVDWEWKNLDSLSQEIKDKFTNPWVDGYSCPLLTGDTMFEKWSDFNAALRDLAGGENRINTFVRDDSYLLNPKSWAEEIVISSPDSKLPIYAWYDSTNRTVYYYTQASGVYLNSDSSFMFSGYSNLKNVVNSDDWNTSMVTNMEGMFQNCYSLTGLNVSNWNTSNVTNMRLMFWWRGNDNWMNLEYLDVSKWNTSKVTNMEAMFQNCNKLARLDVSKWNTSRVTNMNHLFFECNSLEELDVSKWNTSRVTNMRSLFASCISLTGLDVSNWDTSNVTDMWFMFWWNGSDKMNLEYLNVGNFDTSKVVNMQSMFQNCIKLTSLDVDWSKWNTSKVTNMETMFIWLESLESLKLCGWDTSNATNISGMFATNYNLKTIYVSSGFKTDKVVNWALVFTLDRNLVWWNGTTYNASRVDKTYARIDKAWQPWYFTACEKEPECILDPTYAYSCVVWNDNLRINDGPGSSYIQLDDTIPYWIDNIESVVYGELIEANLWEPAYWALVSDMGVSWGYPSEVAGKRYWQIGTDYIPSDGEFHTSNSIGLIWNNWWIWNNWRSSYTLYARQARTALAKLNNSSLFNDSPEIEVYQKVNEDSSLQVYTSNWLNCGEVCSKTWCTCYDKVYDARCELKSRFTDEAKLEQLKEECEQKSEDECAWNCIWIWDSDPSSYTCKWSIPSNASLNNPDAKPTNNTTSYHYSRRDEPCAYDCNSGYAHKLETYTNKDICVKLCTVTYDANGWAFNEHSENHVLPGFGERKWDVTYYCDETLNPRVGERVPIPFLTWQCFDWWYSQKSWWAYVEEGFSIWYDRTLYAHWWTYLDWNLKHSVGHSYIDIYPNWWTVTYVYTDWHEKTISPTTAWLSSDAYGNLHYTIQDECGAEIKFSNVSGPDWKTLKWWNTSCREVWNSYSNQKIYSLTSPYRGVWWCWVSPIWN